jgi:hypothetical protein
MHTQPANLPPEKCSYEACCTRSGCGVASYASYHVHAVDVKLWLSDTTSCQAATEKGWNVAESCRNVSSPRRTYELGHIRR